jgi:DNA/RNA-binding domain of Phe-tRNA-synthetase-like protein
MKIEPHPLLDAAVFKTEFPNPMAEMEDPDWLATLRQGGPAPFSTTDEIRKVVRDLFRVAGYKPTGRGKPASEYLVKAAADGGLSSINAAVDVCNVVSLGSGLPISVVDAARIDPPLCVKIAGEDGTYVFNPSGQAIRFQGLFSLYDQHGPCANGVKDSQRTKTGPDTTSTVTVIWGTTTLSGRTAQVLEWYTELLQRLGANVDNY